MSSGPQELRAFWTRAVGLAASIILIGAGVLYAWLDNGGAAAFGLVLGGVASIVRFNMRYKALRNLRSAGPLVRARLAGYVLNAVVLAAAFARPDLAWPWTTAAGLFVMNASVIAAELLSPRSDPATT